MLLSLEIKSEPLASASGDWLMLSQNRERQWANSLRRKLSFPVLTPPARGRWF